MRQNTAPPELPAQPRVNHPTRAGIVNKTEGVTGQSGLGSAYAGPHLLVDSFNEHSSGACSAPHRGEDHARAAAIAYATLERHLIAGEERMSVHWRAAFGSHTVSLDLREHVSNLMYF